MVNTKPVGVAYSDPALTSGTTIDGATIGGTTTGAGSFTTLAASSTSALAAVTATTVAATGAITGASVTVTGSNAIAANATGGIYLLAVAITANSTTTTAPVGSLGTTSHATGNTKIFISDGTKWQYPAIT